MLRFWNTIAGDNLPACVQYAVTRQGAPGGLPRAPMPASTDAQTAAIDQALAAVLAFEPAPVARAAE